MTAIFDAVIIGAGQAGPALAGRLTAAGMKDSLVERTLLVGPCVNTGCMPAETQVTSAPTMLRIDTISVHSLGADPYRAWRSHACKATAAAMPMLRNGIRMQARGRCFSKKD